jgi:SAM-dependent MidA family methyltransferase
MSPGGESAPAHRGSSARGPQEGLPPLSEEERRRELAVLARIAEAADASGYLRFDRFMECALYSPGVGFYSRPGASLGPRGEFYTAPHVSPLFGRAVARRIAREHALAGRPDRWVVVELGAGDGTLAASVVAALPEEVGLGVDVSYTIVDRSPDLGAAALERARAAAPDGAVRVTRADSLSEAGPLRGVVLANELLDALPFRRLVRRDGAWREIGVRCRAERLEWAEGPSTEGSLPAGLPDAPDATELEVSPAAEALPREIADHLAGGVALLVDYGMEEHELLSGHPLGTLEAVRRHRIVADPLAHPGLTDLSAFVNFTRVRAAARAAGLEEVAFRPQRECLVDWGIEPLLEREIASRSGGEHEVRTRLAVKNLLIGFDRFQVLELASPIGRRA